MVYEYKLDMSLWWLLMYSFLCGAGIGAGIMAIFLTLI